MSKEIENMTFEEAFKELEQNVKKIDNAEETLESAIAAFERSTKLKLHCEQKLQEAKMKIEKIVKNAEGNVTLEKTDLV